MSQKSEFETITPVQGTALVLGVTGGIGGEMARVLLARGWSIRALHRDPDRVASRAPGIDWRRGDAMMEADVIAAAAGVDLIVHAVNPPGYRNWGELVLPMLDSTIAAARASGATVLLPGTVYNFGPDVLPRPSEDAPQNPVTAKGRIRAAMERRLKELASSGGRVIILRCGDFFGPRSGNTWFGQGLVKAGAPVTRVLNPGEAGVGHQWAYLPDVAEAMARLVDVRARLPAFAVFHMRGHWDADGTAMAGAIARAVGRPDLPVRRFPWWLVRLASPVVPLFRELMEMRYLWRVPLEMGNDRLVAAIGPEPHTPLDPAVAATLSGIGCLGDAGQAGAAAAVR